MTTHATVYSMHSLVKFISFTKTTLTSYRACYTKSRTNAMNSYAAYHQYVTLNNPVERPDTSHRSIHTRTKLWNRNHYKKTVTDTWKRACNAKTRLVQRQSHSMKTNKRTHAGAANRLGESSPGCQKKIKNNARAIMEWANDNEKCMKDLCTWCISQFGQ